MSTAKKIILILATILIIGVTIVTVCFVTTETGLLEKKEDVADIITMYTEDGKLYTESRWAWSPVTSREKIKYDESLQCNTAQHRFLLSDGITCSLDIPDVPVITDYGKSIYAVDGSFSVRVLHDVNVDTVVSTAGIANGESVSRTIYCTKSGTKGKCSVVRLFEEYSTAIVIDVYTGSEYFTAMYKSLINTKEIKPLTVEYSTLISDVEGISYTGEYSPYFTFTEGTYLLQQQYFADGWINAQTITDSLSNVLSNNVMNTIALYGTPTIQHIDEVYLLQTGEMYVCIVERNSNTCVVLTGCGEEAYCNIVHNIKMLTE